MEEHGPVEEFEDIIIETKAETGESYPNIAKLPVYDNQIHHICVGGFLYDDNKILRKQNCTKYKISKVTIGTYNSYVSNMQFSYLNFETGKEIDGQIMGKQWAALSMNKTLKLKIDEYLIGFTIRAGLIIDRLGLITTHGSELIVGGNGGLPSVFMGEPGYHVGAISASIQYALSGFQFNLLAIPKQKNQQKKQPFIFFENERLFGFAIKYLTLRQTMHLFLINKKLAEYRKTSDAFWMKCISLCDPFAQLYLKKIAQQAKNPGLEEIIKVHQWADFQLQIGHLTSLNFFNTARFIPSVMMQLLKPTNSYVIVVGFRFSNQTFQYGTLDLKLFMRQYNKLFDIKVFNENTRALTKDRLPLLTRKVAFVIKASSNQQLLQLTQKMENWLFLTARDKIEKYFQSWTIDYFCMLTQCNNEQINWSGFEKIEQFEELWINCKHLPIFMDKQ